MERLRRLVYAESLPIPPPGLIPDELIREILLLLPVKSLIRFRCVCKSWMLIISDLQFAKLHLHRSIANAADFTYTRLLFDSFNSLTNDNWPRSNSLLFFSSQNQKAHDFYPIECRNTLIGVCNGLVSLVNEKGETSSMVVRVRLWNPTMRLWSQWSPPLLQPTVFYNSYGFGYDCLNDTYKAVIVNCERIEEHGESVVKVYEMGESCWRSIQSFHTTSLISWWSYENGVYAIGTLNWIVMLNTEMLIIVSLDLGREGYSQLTLPNSLQYGCAPVLGVLKDCLCILHNDDYTRFQIWQMKEFGVHESWTQLFNFDFEQDIFGRVCSFDPYGFVLSDNGEVLLVSDEDLGLYNHRDKTFEYSSHRKERNYHLINSWNLENHIESLISPY